jgi:hypothetical protein
MSFDDPVETETPVFTEEDVYMIGGWLAEAWGVTEDAAGDTDKAIQAVLGREKP